jgi:hypothetical protein
MNCMSSETKKKKKYLRNVSLNVLELTQRIQFHDYPDVLTAKHIPKILGTSQSATYGIMDQKEAREGF